MEEEVAPVLKGGGEGGGDGGAGAGEEVYEVPLWVAAARETARAGLAGSPVAAQPVGAVPPREHPCLDGCGPDCGAGGGAVAPHRVGAAAEGDEGRAEVAEAWQGGGLCHQHGVPVTADCRLNLLLPSLLGWRRVGEGDQGVREGVEAGDAPDLGEAAGGDAVVQDIESVAV